MPSILGSIVVAFNADTSGFNRGVSAAKKAISDFNNSAGGTILNGVTAGLVAVGTAAAGVAVKSTQMAADFQTGLTSLVTGAGESASAIKQVGTSILGISTTTGTSTQQLISGMYQIDSAGYTAAKGGLTVLQNAAEGAKVGNADLGTVADATTTIMTDFGISAGKSASVVNTLIATVASGKTTMQQLASSLSQIMPTASAAGISLTDTSAAMATMTGEGVPAANAATYLRQTILGLEAPSAGTVKALASVGLTSKEVSDEMKKSLPDALQMITDAVGKKFPVGSAEYVAAIKNISGGAKTMQGMLDLTGQHMATFKDNVTNIAQAVEKGGNSITGWSLVQGTFNQQMAEATAAVNVLMIKIGQALLPVVSRLMAQILPLLTQFTNWITTSGVLTTITNDLMTGVTDVTHAIAFLVTTGIAVVSFFKNNQLAMDGLIAALTAVASVMVGLVVSALYTLAAAMIPVMIESLTLAAPWILAGIAIAAVVFGIIVVVQHWSQIMTTLHNLLNTFVSAVQGIFSQVRGTVSGVIGGVIGWFNQWKGIIEGVAIVLGVFFGPALIKAGIQAVQSGSQIALNFIRSLQETGTAAIVNGARTTASFVQSMIQSGTEAVINGAKVTVSFIGSMIRTGAEAVINGAKVTVSFVKSLIQTGIEGWASAGKLGTFIVSMITTGAQAVINGAKVVASFVASMVTAGAQAIASGARIAASFIVSIVQAGAASIIAGAQMVAALVPAFLSWAAGAIAAAAATIAATWPILLIIAAIALLAVGIYLLVTHWTQVVAFLRGLWTGFMTWLQGALASVKAFFTNIWNSITGFLQGVWNTIVSLARAFGVMLLAVILGPIGILVILIAQHWTQITSFLSNAWNNLIGMARSLWSRITSTITGLVGGLVGQMFSFGQNLIQGFINGITSMLGNVANAASNVMNTVKNFLGFHSPAKMGPGAELDIWGPNLAKGFAQGLERGIPMVQASVQHLISPTTQLGVSHAGQGHGAGGAAGGSRVAQPIIIEMNGQEIARAIAHDVGKEQQRIMLRKSGRGL